MCDNALKLHINITLKLHIKTYWLICPELCILNSCLDCWIIISLSNFILHFQYDSCSILAKHRNSTNNSIYCAISVLCFNCIRNELTEVFIKGLPTISFIRIASGHETEKFSCPLVVFSCYFESLVIEIIQELR